MGGNQKSSKIDSLKDQYGRIVYNRHELYDMIYDGIDVSDIKTVDWNEDFDKFNSAIVSNHLNEELYTAIDKLSMSLEEFDEVNQTKWFMPDEYKDDDYVTAYRKYYQGAKSYFAKWERGVSAPDWWVSA